MTSLSRPSLCSALQNLSDGPDVILDGLQDRDKQVNICLHGFPPH
jgi:hypothetical protein